MMPIELTEEDREVIESVLRTEKYAMSPVPDEVYDRLAPDFLALVFVPHGKKLEVARLYGEGSNALHCLAADWSCAFAARAMRMFNERAVTFPTRVVGSNGTPVELSISENKHESTKPWFLSYVPNLDAFSLRRNANGALDELPTPTCPPPSLYEEGFDEMRASGDYQGSPVSPEALVELEGAGELLDFAWPQRKSVEKLVECAPAGTDLKGLLNRDFAYALQTRTLRSYEDKVLFPVSLLRKDGHTPVEVTIKRDDRLTQAAGSKPWVIVFVDDHPRVRRTPAGQALEKWAHIGDWGALLQTLANMALPEKWGFQNSGEPFAILKNYLIYTFYRLQFEGKVLESSDHGLAAFDTGLVDKTYESIYACFVPEPIGAVHWRFEAFCKAGSRQWGKKLVSTFNPLPQRAQYFTCKEDLLFDGDRPLQRDIDHILLDNIGRLPREFLEEELRGNDEALECLGRLCSASGDGERAVAASGLRGAIENDVRTKRRLVNRLDDAIELAQKRVEWNFKTAVPAFYPTKNSMSLLLPLDLTEDERPDVALVVELLESGVYIGQTILTMRMAYNNARLISRPDSDWLNTSIGAYFTS